MNVRVIKLLAATACALLASAAMADPAPGIPDGWSNGFVYSNGARIHYYRAVPRPGKPVMVMVHGITDNGLSWTTLTKDLQDRYDIYMLDARGHGLSDPFNDGNGGDTLVKDVVGFVRAMNLTKPILIGHSMGAATVMRLGAEYPDLPRAVVMLDPSLGRLPAASGAPAPPPEASAGSAPPPRSVGSLVMFGPPEALVAQNNDPFDELVAACGRRHKMWDPVDCQYWALSKKQYHGPYSAAQVQAIRGQRALEDALARITAPALILKADAAPEVREANVRAAGVMKNGRLVHIDGTGHNLHHDDRPRTVQLLNEFFSKL